MSVTCDMANDVPEEYYANLDMSGKRIDLDLRSELKFGTVDFVASKVKSIYVELIINDLLFRNTLISQQGNRIYYSFWIHRGLQLVAEPSKLQLNPSSLSLQILKRLNFTVEWQF